MQEKDPLLVLLRFATLPIVLAYTVWGEKYRGLMLELFSIKIRNEVTRARFDLNVIEISYYRMT